MFPAPPDPVDAIGIDDDGIGEDVAWNENGELQVLIRTPLPLSLVSALCGDYPRLSHFPSPMVSAPVSDKILKGIRPTVNPCRPPNPWAAARNKQVSF